MLGTQSKFGNEELQMLTMQHNHAMDLLQDLQTTLEEQYENAYEMLTNPQLQKMYSRPFTLNLGLIHSILSHIESTCELVSLIKLNPPKSMLLSKKQSAGKTTTSSAKDRKAVQLQNRLENMGSIYLTCKNSHSQESKPKKDELEPNTFMEKYRYSTQLKLKKNQLRQHFLYEIEKGCHNVYTITLESDSMDQENQIQDIDILRFSSNMFKNLSVLNLQDSSITDSSIELFRDRFPQVKHLNLSGCYMLTDRAIKILAEEMGEYFVSLSLNSMNSIKRQSFFSLIESSINLNYLSLKNNPKAIQEDYFIEVYQIYRFRNAQLKWLEITSDHGIDLFINKLMYMTSTNTIQEITDQQLKTLIGDSPPIYTGLFFDNCQQLTKSSLDLIMNKCKKVCKLGLSKFLHLNDSWLRDLTLCLRGIIYLDINCCYNVTDNGLYHVSQNLVGESLEFLVLERCMSVTDEGLRYILEKNALNFLANNKISEGVGHKRYAGGKAGSVSNSLQRTTSNKNMIVNAQNEFIKGTLRHLNISHCKKITDKSLNLLSTSAHSLQSLNISYCDQITDKPIQLISQRLINLKRLNLNYCESLTDSSISMLATRLINKLETLQIQWCEVSQSCVRYIAENLVNLKVLNLSYCPSVVSEQIQLIAQNMTNLHTLKLQACDKISEAAFLKLATSLDKLRVLTLKQCGEVTDTVVKMLTGNNKKLQHLDISWCSKLTDKALFAIAKNCYCLKILNLNGCVDITDEGLQWLSTTVSNMQYLNLTLCSKITDVGLMQITSHMKQLKHLYLSQLQQLTDASITSISNLTKLQQLILTGCTSISSSSLIGLLYNLQKLTQLNISQCRSIDGENLWKICQFMSNIKVLQISQIQVTDQFLSQLSTHCHKIKYLNLCYCNLISDGAVLKMLEKLPRLVKLDIQNTNITDRTIGKIFHALNSRKMQQIVLD